MFDSLPDGNQRILGQIFFAEYDRVPSEYARREGAVKHLMHLAILLIITIPFAQAATGQEIRTCKFEVKARCVSGEARVALANGVVKRVEVDVFWCGLPGKPGYSCSINSSRDDRDSVWSEEEGVTLIANASPFNPAQPDRIKVSVGQFVSIDLDEAQPVGRCGAGAELPRAIVIPSQRAACRVWLK
jgi:hypothetical protein